MNFPNAKNRKKVVLHSIGIKCSFCENTAGFKYTQKEFDREKEWKVIKAEEFYFCKKCKNKFLHDFKLTEVLVGEPTEINCFEFPENNYRSEDGQLLFKTKSIVSAIRKLKLNPNWSLGRKQLTNRELNKQRKWEKGWDMILNQLMFSFEDEVELSANKDTGKYECELCGKVEYLSDVNLSDNTIKRLCELCKTGVELNR